MRCKRIVIIGDSLAMPRPEEGVEYEDTYPYLLFKKGYEVINRSRRANDIKIQTIEQNILDDVIYLKPDVLVIHLGIVDCAPRVFSRTEQRILSLLSAVIRKKIISFFSKRRYFFTKIRQISYVSPDLYLNSLEKFINQTRNIAKQIIFIKIKKTNEYNEKRSYQFNKKIEQYNQIIDLLSSKYEITVIDPNEFKNGLLNDGIHINCQMHHYLANQINKYISY
jgi:hypothetical protein